jgi:glycosidase
VTTGFKLSAIKALRFKSPRFVIAAAAVSAALLVASQVTVPLANQSASPASAADAPQNTPSWAGPATLYEVNVRQFSSTHNFEGVTAALPRLKTLGVGILWLMPIHPIGVPNRKGTLGSPYSVADYLGINPEFGNAAQLRRLINSAHNLGMHVILDWVGNHTAWDNPWTVHKSWYSLDSNNNFQPPVGTDWTDVIQLNYGNQDMRAAMINAMKFWVTNFNVDGFREDAAGMVPLDFWEQAKTALLGTGRSIFMLAEDSARLDFLNQAFSANYNWPGLTLIKNVASGVGSKSDVLSAMNDDNANYPTGSFALNMLTNHDENSWNGTVQHFYGNKEQALAALTFAWPGMPLLYNGQETGLDRQLQFFESDPITFNYSSPLQAFYAKLVSLKAHNKALWAGTAGGSLTTVPSGSPQVLAFARTKGSSKVFIVINLGSSKQKVSLHLGNKSQKLYSFATGKLETVAANKSVALNGWAFNVFSSAR